MNQKRNLRFLDTTLRDGEQSPSVRFTDSCKLKIALLLQSAGIDIIEAGFPSASKKHFESVKKICECVKIPVSAMARSNDYDIDICSEALLGNNNSIIHISVPASSYLRQAKTGLNMLSTMDLALRSLEKIKTNGFRAEVGIEDASRTEFYFIEELCQNISECGADIINIADSSGYMQCGEFGRFIKKIKDTIRCFSSGKSVLSIHCHNDFGLAVSNTLEAILNGAEQVETTICGIGERAGNAQFEAVIAALLERTDYYNVSVNINPKLVYDIIKTVKKEFSFLFYFSYF